MVRNAFDCEELPPISIETALSPFDTFGTTTLNWYSPGLTMPANCVIAVAPPIRTVIGFAGGAGWGARRNAPPPSRRAPPRPGDVADREMPTIHTTLTAVAMGSGSSLAGRHRSLCTADARNQFAKFLARFEEGNLLRWHLDSGASFGIASDARSSL